MTDNLPARAVIALVIIAVFVLGVSVALFGVMGVVERVFDALLFAFIIVFVVAGLKKACEK